MSVIHPRFGETVLVEFRALVKFLQLEKPPAA
jgi:hypothetical protein